jgi:8-oxo-dGTP pyrophosphatase MutT (NUDIX family)
MPHINNGPGEIDETASGFIMRLDGAEPKLLLHEHRKLHTLLQPGGHRGKRDTPWQTVLKEILEETGYAAVQLTVLQPPKRLTHLTGPVLHPLPFCENTHGFPGIDHRHTDRVYAFCTESLPEHVPEQGESNEFTWVTAAELQALPADRIHQDIREMGAYALTVVATEWDRVPISEFEI